MLIKEEHMKRKSASILLVVAAVLWVPGILCASGAKAAQPADTEGEPVPIIWYRPGTIGNPAYIEEVNKRMNVKLEFINETWNDMPQKRNLMLTAGEPFDLVDYMGASDRTFIDNGALQPFDDYVDKAKHPFVYMSINAKTFQGVKVDGKAYFFPGVSHGRNWSLGVRYDWMQELGLSMPKNEVDFYNMLKAFVDMDPTGTTVGMQMEGKMAIRRSMYPILLTFGVPVTELSANRDFIVEGGKLKSLLVADNLKAAFRYVNRLYLEKLINTDFAGFNSYPQLCEKYWYASKCGVAFGNPGRTEETVQQSDPDAVLESIPPWSATGYTFTRGGGALEMDYHALPSSSRYPQKVVDLIEWFNSKEGSVMRALGVEGLNWANLSEDGYFDKLEEWDTTQDYWWGMGSASMYGWIPYWDYGTFEEAYDHRVILVARSEKDAKTSMRWSLAWGAKWFGSENPFRFVSVPNTSDISVELSDAVEIGWIKMVAAGPGQFDAEWDAYVRSLDDAGFQQWVAAYQNYYDKNMK